MSVQGQAMTQTTEVGLTIEAGGLAWVQRLCQWFKGRAKNHRHSTEISQYGTWDPQREQFKPFRADAAIDLVAAQHGAYWSARIYSSWI
jgi:hypothetical protein